MSSISFLGAAGTVTGSSFLFTPNSSKSILIDLGMFQGDDEVEALNYLPLHFDTSNLLAVILTHAHLDHAGRLPLLVKNGYRGPIYMTEATRVLTEITLLDAAKVASDHTSSPLYTEEDVFRTLSLMEILDYHKQMPLGPLRVTMYDAGHILGSASIEIIDKSEGSDRIIIFSGDLGNSPEDLVRPTEYFDKADYVVMESTYGDRSHNEEDPDAVLSEEIEAIEASGGTLLIPAFSLERVQEILHKIDHLKKTKKVKDTTPVYLDSPMAIKATNVYRHFRNLYNTELSRHVTQDDPFDFPGLHFVEKSRDSFALHKNSGPQVIIAGSGMMNGGRILNHAAHYLPFDSTRILIVGFQAENTIGRRIIDGASEVKINRVVVPINASVRKSSGMSAHADQPKLIRWLKSIDNPKKVFLVHGEDLSRVTLSEVIKSQLGIKEVVCPSRNEDIILT